MQGYIRDHTVTASRDREFCQRVKIKDPLCAFPWPYSPRRQMQTSCTCVCDVCAKPCLNPKGRTTCSGWPSSTTRANSWLRTQGVVPRPVSSKIRQCRGRGRHLGALKDTPAPPLPSAQKAQKGASLPRAEAPSIDTG